MTGYDKNRKKDDTKLLVWIIVVFLFVVWLCTPPGNKFLQICFWGNNTKLFIAKLTPNSGLDEYKFYRNNAVYIAKMFPKDKKKAIREINKAIAMLPSYESDAKLQALYKDRAYIELYYGDKVGALNDFLRSGELSLQDYLPVALLFKENGDYKNAISYCNAIINVDPQAYAGFVCLSEVYVSAGRPDVSEKLWDLAIDRKSSNHRFYVERAKIRKSLGNEQGAENDIAKAKEYSPTVNTEYSLVNDTLQPKVLTLAIN